MCDHAAILAKGTLVSVGAMDSLLRATSRVRLLLVTAPGDPEGALALLRSIEGVRSAAVSPDDPRAIDLELADDAGGGADQVANQVLKKLIELGVAIKSMERGQSLEQRFIEETRRV
jgi:ABC-type multidrug transport system ATPase subunit